VGHRAGAGGNWGGCCLGSLLPEVIALGNQEMTLG
jgi:hypothetical protein